MDFLERLKKFHSHLGPFAVLGARMGKYAKNELKATPFELEAEVYTTMHTPESCVLDGVQFSSGCTLGKRNIIPKKSREIKGIFWKGNKEVTLTLKESILQKIRRLKEEEIEEYATKLMKKKITVLFKTEKSWEEKK
ncbi:MAG: formylmethanofuran dehydrogenase [Candidatus Korarchaeota archaeon]|nr:formylmethanofuran dehydrogenase [Candidatus Korarchaeota archaeon]NIU82170.1 formylmethanofuran dehydrogenase [Candidatus Thorarchaeota archaeon]NIW14052.1 formylmethanofuran dehydrogenase [Candidatus Thorarchaeota archaeon]NIW52155.1 formylmethanofuran dehydrogenase [Candidatus Korarchaeota archaeon]